MAVAQLIQPKKQKNMSCDASSSIGDLVFLNPLNPNSILSAQDNNSNLPIIGLIIDKPTDTVARVLLNGLLQLDTVIASGKIFVGLSGGLTLNGPTTGHLQQLGFSFGDGVIDFNPSSIRVKRS